MQAISSPHRHPLLRKRGDNVNPPPPDCHGKQGFVVIDEYCNVIDRA